ncbi:MAG TPA: hypothetical protein VIF62_23485 [Labilithrix sp.]
MRRIGVFLVAALLGACDFGTLADLNEDTAAQGADELTTQALSLWRTFDPMKATDADVKKAIADIQGIVARNPPPLQVRLGPIDKDDQAIVGITDKDPSTAQGMLLIHEIDCSLDQISKLVIALNQTAIYPDLYDSYTRVYTSDVNGFLEGTPPTVTWTTNYQASALSRTYQSEVRGEGRYVGGAMPNGAPIFLDRAFLPHPALFIKGGDDSGFDQDYQIELYYETAPNKVMHFYALWRDFHISTVSSDTDLYVNLVLGNLSDFDVRSSKVCKDGSPQPAFQ